MPTTFPSELSLRQWAIAQSPVKINQIEPAMNSTLGLPDFNLNFNSISTWIELKLAKPKSKNFFSQIRPNQKKQLKRINHLPGTAVGLLVAIKDTPRVYAVLITSMTLTGDFDFLALQQSKLAVRVETFLEALAFFQSHILVKV